MAEEETDAAATPVEETEAPATPVEETEAPATPIVSPSRQSTYGRRESDAKVTFNRRASSVADDGDVPQPSGAKQYGRRGSNGLDRRSSSVADDGDPPSSSSASKQYGRRDSGGAKGFTRRTSSDWESGPALLLAALKRESLDTASILRMLRILNVSTIEHLKAVTYGELIETGFSRAETRKLTLIATEPAQTVPRTTRRASSAEVVEEGEGTTNPLEEDNNAKPEDDFLNRMASPRPTEVKNYKTQMETMEAQRTNLRASIQQDLTIAAEEYRQRPKVTIPEGPTFHGHEAPKSPPPKDAYETDAEKNKNWTHSLRDFFGLTQERKKYEARGLDSDGKVNLTVPAAFNFFGSKAIVERSAARRASHGGVEGPSDALLAGGYTQAEVRAREAEDVTRKAMSAGLTAERQAYEAREKDADGKVKLTEVNPFSFLFTSARKKKRASKHAAGAAGAGGEGGEGEGGAVEKDAAEAPPVASHTFAEQMNAFSSTLRDWLGLAREHEAYDKRIAAQGGAHATVAEGFAFREHTSYTAQRAARGEAGPEQATIEHINAEEMAKHSRDLRKTIQEENTKAAEEFNARERDEEGRVVSTVAVAPVFASDARREEYLATHEALEPTYHSSVNAEELNRYKRDAAKLREQEAIRQREEYQERQRQGRLGTEAEGFQFAEHPEARRVAYEPHEYPEALTVLSQKAADAQRRKEMEEINSREAEAYAKRMGIEPKPRTSYKDSRETEGAFAHRNKLEERPVIMGGGIDKAELAKAQKHTREDNSEILAAERAKFMARMASRQESRAP